MRWEARKRSRTMAFANILILLLASVLGGTLNSVAGGGSFITFPTLIYIGVSPIQANATSTTGLWPASASATWALRKELAMQNRVLLLVLGIPSFIGGIGGAIVLLKTPQTTFTLLIPFLMLLATLLFAFSPLVNTRLRQRAEARKKRSAETVEISREEKSAEAAQTSLPWIRLAGLASLQFVIAIYGGYFGGGIGILMLATLGLMGMENIHEMNAVKNTLAACINGLAVIVFILFGAIDWPSALVMVVGTIAGGFGGAYYARKLDPRLIRGFVILVGCVMTLYFFFKYFL